jgi:hypothetical protein
MASAGGAKLERRTPTGAAGLLARGVPFDCAGWAIGVADDGLARKVGDRAPRLG